MGKNYSFKTNYLFTLIIYLQKMGAQFNAEFLALFKSFNSDRKIVAFLFTARPFVFVWVPVFFLFLKKLELVWFLPWKVFALGCCNSAPFPITFHEMWGHNCWLKRQNNIYCWEGKSIFLFLQSFLQDAIASSTWVKSRKILKSLQTLWFSPFNFCINTNNTFPPWIL